MILYVIENTETNRVYVGITSRKLSQRWGEHMKSYRDGSNQPIYRAMRRYGVEKFTIRKADIAETWEELCEKEIKLISKLTKEFCYNASNGGEGSPGHVVSEETREKIRAKHIGKKLTPEHRAKLSAAKMGKKLPPRSSEHSAKISQGLVAAHARKKNK